MKHIYHKIGLWLIVLLTLAACGTGDILPPTAEATSPSLSPSPMPEASSTASPQEEAPVDWVESQITQMTLEEQVGQLLIAGFSGTEISQETAILIQDYHVGGLILFSRNVESVQQLTDLTNGLKGQNIEDVPLFLSIDQEGSLVNRMPAEVDRAPNAWVVGQLTTEENRGVVAEAFGSLLGLQCQSFGIQLNFAPSLDIWSNPQNTVIGQRAFDDQAEVVAELGSAAAYGMMEQGVIPVVKHFPGHGDTAEDSHTSLPVVTKTLEELETMELIPFRQAIDDVSGTGDSPIPAVMVGHILLTELDPDHPASLSQAVVQGLLREELGFEGVVFTDDMTMGAITQVTDLGEGVVQAIQAGCDVVLVCHDAENVRLAYQALLDAVASGRISQERLEESVRRILQLKYDYQLSDNPVEQPDVAALNQATEDFYGLLNP